MSTQESQVTLDEIDEKSVLYFLEENPEFFLDNLDLVAKLDIPHPSGSAISLIEHQVRILRERNDKLNKKFKLMVTNARANDKINEKIFDLAYKLINSNDLEESLQVVEDSLFDKFQANNVAIKLYDPNAKLCQTRFDAVLTKDDKKLSMFKAFIASGRPHCGRIKLEQLQFLFGKLAKQVQSAALVPIGKHCEFGFLAIGSLESKRFHPGKDTTFLAHLANLVTSAVRNHI